MISFQVTCKRVLIYIIYSRNAPLIKYYDKPIIVFMLWPITVVDSLPFCLQFKILIDYFKCYMCLKLILMFRFVEYLKVLLNYC